MSLPDNIPEAARIEVEKLLKGNKNFINGTPTAKNMCLSTLQSLASHQAPYACILTCSDSRVVPEIIFDCGIGELFVVRVAGMTVGPNIIESIDSAIKNLDEDKFLEVLPNFRYAFSNLSPVEIERFSGIIADKYNISKNKILIDINLSIEEIQLASKIDNEVFDLINKTL